MGWRRGRELMLEKKKKRKAADRTRKRPIQADRGRHQSSHPDDDGGSVIGYKKG